MGCVLFCLVFAVFLVGASGSTAYSSTDQTTLLDKHNTYRTGVSPEASNMNKLEWNSDLDELAQDWVDKCFFNHPDTDTYPQYASSGQNLFITYPSSSTTPPAVTAPVVDWYNEHTDYTYSSNACTSGRVCGHYTQVVWANTTELGCGIKFCTDVHVLSGGVQTTYSNLKAWLVACQYRPRGNYGNQKPYESGSHCSKCSGGKYCENKLCTNCNPDDSGCECKIGCQNCGTKSTDSCSCSCPNGYYGTVCENHCVNHAYCGANPGWPSYWCPVYDFVKENCPLMCGLCNAGAEANC